MKTARHPGRATLVWALSLCCGAGALAQDCELRDQVDAHVLRQFSIYGPLSIEREYFGFIYLHDGAIDSAIERGRTCLDPYSCKVNTAAAAALIPHGARVLGEWHTHPQGGSVALSADDVRGAHNNRHIRCYLAFYGKPTGQVFAWDPHQTSVPTAMATRALIGNFREKLAGNADESVRYVDRVP